MGCHEISLGDTIGVGSYKSVTAMLNEVLKVAPGEEHRFAVHFHDTYGQGNLFFKVIFNPIAFKLFTALPNILTSLDHGITVVDTAVSGRVV